MNSGRMHVLHYCISRPQERCGNGIKLDMPNWLVEFTEVVMNEAVGKYSCHYSISSHSALRTLSKDSRAYKWWNKTNDCVFLCKHMCAHIWVCTRISVLAVSLLVHQICSVLSCFMYLCCKTNQMRVLCCLSLLIICNCLRWGCPASNPVVLAHANPI